jgi:magnesium-transporting ATPase (P-type)
MQAICPAHLILLDLITRMILEENYFMISFITQIFRFSCDYISTRSNLPPQNFMILISVIIIIIIIVIIIFTPCYRISVYEPESNLVPGVHYVVASGKYVNLKLRCSGRVLFPICPSFSIPRWSVYQGCHIDYFEIIVIRLQLYQ